MYIPDKNFYISDKYQILFDLNSYRIFFITDKIYNYFTEKVVNDLDENERAVLDELLSDAPNNTIGEMHYEAVKIHVSNACNLKCKYCYAHGGNYGGADSLMDMKTAKRVVEFINTSPEMRNLQYITFFGGEPLMNPEVIEYICDQTKHRNVTYLLQTNGTIISEKIIDILKKYQIVLTISLDGPKEVNDFNRVDKYGNGTYEKIMNNIMMLQKNNVDVKAIEATVSEEFVSCYSKWEIANYINEKTGIHNIAVTYDNRSDKSFNTVDTIKDGVKAFFEKCYAGEYVINNEAYKVMNTFFSQQYNDCFCVAGNKMLSVDVHGEFYPCQLFLERKDLKMGSVQNNVLMNKFAAKTKSVSESCQLCEARSTCTVCLAERIDDEQCKKNKICQSMVLETLAQYIAEGKFETFYNNFVML